MSKMSVWTNLVYGQPYAGIFLEYHLKSFLDPTNIPAVKERIHYEIFTDRETKPVIEKHPNFIKLKETCSVGVSDVTWPQGVVENRFAFRYHTLINVFQASVQIALKKDAYLSAIVADLVCAKNFLPPLLEKMDKGHGAVFMLPLRSCFETIAQHLAQVPGALEAKDLFQAGYENLHPLWWACHYDNPCFTKLPFSLLWNSGTGLLAKSFSVTPLIFRPTVHMSYATQVIDVAIPSFCRNVYWCEDWTDAPIIGAEPIICYYPTFQNKKAVSDDITNWAFRTLHVSQYHHLPKSLYFPSKEAFGSEELTKVANDVSNKIVSPLQGIVH